MLTSLFQKRSPFYLYRLVKPNISEFKSIEDLEFDIRQRQIQAIQQTNNIFLTYNKSYTKQKQIMQALSLQQQKCKSIMQKNWKYSGIAPKSLKHFTVQQNLKDGKIDYPFLLQQIQQNLPDFNSIPMHFSYKRGVPIINEYQIDKKVIYVFNLPQNVNQQQLSQKIGLQTIKNIKIQYCRLGLPAYAKVYFNSDQSVTNLVLNNKHFIQLQNRICFIKTHFDKQKLQLKNRTLAIKNLKSYQHDVIIQLSKYGRIIHLDYPTFITRNTSLQEVKAKYKNQGTLIKINVHKKDGSIDSQYYPTIQQLYEMKTSQNSFDLDSNLIQKRQRQTAEYRNRMRFAPQVNVHEGKQNQISVQNMEYCVVTFSCTQQAQNCYFNLRFTNRIQLYDRKNIQQFQIDQSYKKKILRFIDYQHTKAKLLIQDTTKQHQKQYQQQFDQLNLFDKLLDLQTRQKQLRQNNDLQFGDLPVVLSYFNTRLNQIKRDLRKQLKSASFDQLAEKQLFGKVLPKHDSKKSKLQFDLLPLQDQLMSEFMNNPTRIKDLDTQKITARQESYKYLKRRQTKRKTDVINAKNAQQAEFAEGAQLGEGQILQDMPVGDEDQNLTGKRGFSTIKKKNFQFRQRNPLQMANYILKYSQYIKDTINQYQGVFSQNRLKINQIKYTFLNPDGLQFSDGSDYITQDDLCKILECNRNTQKSQNILDQFWKNYEYFKSKNIDIYQFRNLMQTCQYSALQRYSDVGVVKEVYELEEGENADDKVKYLNATIAGFGQQFKVHQKDGQRVIVKICKVQQIFPLDKINKISNQKQKFDKQVTVSDKQKKLFQKYKYQMIQTGQIPSQVRKQFNIPQNQTLDDLFEQLASQAGINKKDIQMILNLQNFTSQQIGQSIGLQVQIQKVRCQQKQSKASDFAKDPSNIQIRDKQGFFKVSKFRQI